MQIKRDPLGPRRGLYVGGGHVAARRWAMNEVTPATVPEEPDGTAAAFAAESRD